jgi:hypothetical protein
MGFASNFLIVWDFCNYARANTFRGSQKEAPSARWWAIAWGLRCGTRFATICCSSDLWTARRTEMLI